MLSVLALAGCATSAENNGLYVANDKLTGKFNKATSAAYNVEDSIVVNKPLNEAFAFVTDLNNAALISEHVGDIRIADDSLPGVGNRYSRSLQIHKSKVRQEVVVIKYRFDEMYTTSTRLFGVKVDYVYLFEALGDDKTRIRLIREIKLAGLADRLPLSRVVHQLTRPEHDGQHLSVLKQALEAQNTGDLDT